MNAILIKNALDCAIKSAAEKAVRGQPFRNCKLSVADTICLLIGAEGGSLDKILHTAGIEVTVSAVSQHRAQIAPVVFRLSRTFIDTVIQPEPKKDEIGALVTMLKRNSFDQKTLLIAGHGFESYNMIAYLLEKPNVDFLIRVKQSRSAMREVAKLPMLELDCDISFTICTTQKNTDKQNQNYVFLQVPKKSKPGSKTRCGYREFIRTLKMDADKLLNNIALYTVPI